MKNSLLEMFDSICLPHGDKEKLKENKIMEILKDFNPQYFDGVGIIIPSITTNPKKVIVSHYDLVGNFKNGFKQGKKFFINEEENILQGALDNTLTNAFLILAILELRKSGLAQDVEFLFTDGEESGLWGMSSYMQNFFSAYEEKPFFINLDVTNDNFKKSGSIEFDFPCFDICAQIENAFPGINGFTNVRFTDDTSSILRNGGNGFSFCIPTDKYCHIYDSYTFLSYIEPYYEVLKFLISELDCSNYVNDLSSLSTELISGISYDSPEIDSEFEEVLDLVVDNNSVKEDLSQN